MTVCKRCGNSMVSTTAGDDICFECKNKKSNVMGWICPSCGKSLSPNVLQCNCKNNNDKLNNEGLMFEGKTVLIE